MRAIRVITDEHRALTAVIHGMLSLLRHVRYGIAEPNFELFRAMLYYIGAFPERFHHPKEDAYLFRLLRQRQPSMAPLLDRLHAEHELGTVKFKGLQDALAQFERDRDGGLNLLYAAVADYAAFQYAHVRAEEDSVLPAAAEHLIAADWEEIDAAFADHANPLFGAPSGTEYDELFRRVVALAPAPLGAAPERRL